MTTRKFADSTSLVEFWAKVKSFVSNAVNVTATTGISIADHSTTSITGVGSSITVSSKKSGGNGTAPTLGTAFTIPNVTSAGSASNWVFEDITVPKAASSATACDDITDWSAGSGSFTSGTFNGGSGSASLTFDMDTTDTRKLKIAFSHTHTAATHEADSHSHTAPSLSYTARSITGVSGSTTASHVKSGGNGSAPTLGTAFTVPNVTSVGSASNWAFENKTVATAASSATTVVTGKTHTVTDNGHTHTNG